MTIPAVSFENYKDCLIGVAQIRGDVIYVYDKNRIINRLMEQGKLSYRQALAFFDQNFDIDMGPRSPAFFSPLDNKEISV